MGSGARGGSRGRRATGRQSGGEVRFDEAPDCLLEALRGASMDEDHRTLMSAVIQKVLSAKSGLTEACTSLLTGFEVSNKNV